MSGKKYDSGKPRYDLIPETFDNFLRALEDEDLGVSDPAPSVREALLGYRKSMVYASSDQDLAQARDWLEDAARAVIWTWCGVSFAQGNPDVHQAVRGVAFVLGYGADKYGENNWQELKDFRRRYFAAALRHHEELAEAMRDGVNIQEARDAESGLPHAAHLLTNIAFLHSDLVGHDVPLS